MGLIYLLHFDAPFKHARHYIGYAEKDVDQRVAKHRKGWGTVFMRRVFAAGIGFQLARVWHDVTRQDERKLKKQGGASRICPICKAAALEAAE